MEGFSVFLRNEEDQLANDDLLSLIEKDDWYFKFSESDSKGGTFFRVRYFQTANTFSIYA
jgi:hypothetical protein